jgi:hypothetical protein
VALQPSLENQQVPDGARLTASGSRLFEPLAQERAVDDAACLSTGGQLIGTTSQRTGKPRSEWQDEPALRRATDVGWQQSTRQPA